MKSIRKEDISAIYYTNEHNKLHRIDGPANEYSDGDKIWFINGLGHRIDGPVTEHLNGNKFWRLYGQYHRIDGPACKYHTGNKFFYLFDKIYSETQHSYATEHYDSLMGSNEYFGERE